MRALDKQKRQALFSWLFVAALFTLCGVLGVLQYRWIGEVSLAARDRLRTSLHASLQRLSQDFNSELTASVRAIAVGTAQPDEQGVETEVAARYAQWSRASRHDQLFRRIAITAPEEDTVALRVLDPRAGTFVASAWPEGWKRIKERMESRMPPGEGWRGRPAPQPPSEEEDVLLEFPLFRRPPAGEGGPPMRFRPREPQRLILEVNLAYVRDAMLPELLHRHLGVSGSADYQVEVVSRRSPRRLIFESQPGAKRISGNADASMGLFELQFDQLFRGPDGRGGRGPGQGPNRAAALDLGRWQMSIRHRSGSLEAVVAQTRWRNLAVTGGVLLLLMVTVGAMVRFTRHAQKLAQLQMEFVAGVSHELRTPLTVIHTAAYNLRGKLAANPAQVERYGALIQQESGRLKDLVEQVLRFANAKAGRLLAKREPVSLDSVIEQAIKSSKAAVESASARVEKNIDNNLPLVMGDAASLQHALQNLLSNAAKYGTEGNDWIGVFATTIGNGEQPAVEIRVVDRGPGIPASEQSRIFDPFFRGKRALEDQIHGTGLGLSLVKDIVQAHGGTIEVHSHPDKGTEFVVRIPAAPLEYEDEFADTASGG